MHPKHRKEASVLFLTCAFSGFLSLLVYEKMGFHFADQLHALDRHMVEWIFNHRTPFLNDLFLFITVLGNEMVGWTVAAIASLYLFMRKRQYFLPFIAIGAGSALSVLFLKQFIARARPAEDFAYYAVNSFSFPSGHATMAVVLYGFLTYVLISKIPSATMKWIVGLLGIALAMLIGISRWYLGVHFASDVIGGFLLGGIWLLLGIHFCHTHLALHQK